MMHNTKNRGSITLEAAIVVPLFVIIMLLMNGLFVMFMGQQIMTHTLIQSSKSMANDPYATQRGAADESDKLAEMFGDIFAFVGGDYVSTEKWYESDSIEHIVKKKYIAYLKKSQTDADQLLDVIGVKDGISGLDFSGSSIVDGTATVKLKYTQEFIFNAAGLAEFEREICLRFKLFEYIELK